MDCAGDPERGGDTEQGSGCLLFRNGHGRGTLRVGYLCELWLTVILHRCRYSPELFLLIIACLQQQCWQ